MVLRPSLDVPFNAIVSILDSERERFSGLWEVQKEIETRANRFDVAMCCAYSALLSQIIEITIDHILTCYITVYTYRKNVSLDLFIYVIPPMQSQDFRSIQQRGSICEHHEHLLRAHRRNRC